MIGEAQENIVSWDRENCYQKTWLHPLFLVVGFQARLGGMDAIPRDTQPSCAGLMFQGTGLAILSCVDPLLLGREILGTTRATSSGAQGTM